MMAGDPSLDSKALMMPTLSHQVYLVFAINIQMLITGYGVGFSAPCLAQLIKEEVLTAGELEWFAGSLVLGQVLGILLGPVLADRIGRRVTCLTASACSLASWVLLSVGQTGWLLLLARTLTGLTDSLVMPAGIMFISDVAETRLRGTFINTTGLAYCLGIALSYLVGGATSWRLASLVPPFLSCVAIPILVIMKESPVFLLSRDREALAALRWYRREDSEEARAIVREEFHELESSLLGPRLNLAQAVTKLLNGENRKPFMILLVLFGIHPLTGVYSITFFAIDLFEKLGLGSAQAVAVSSALARVLGTALSSGLMHRFGRRPLYIPSCAAATLAMGLIGGLMLLRKSSVELDETVIQWSMIIFIFLFMFSFGVAISNFPWVLMGEWFSPDLTALVTGTLITVQFVSIFLAVQLTGTLMSLLGSAGIFFYFSSVCFIMTVFVAAAVPETHGQTFSHFHTLK